MQISKKGFTLAEVLITLGIIGIVAALTIPALSQNIKGAQNRSKFKKTLSTLNQAVRMNQAKYDFNFADTNKDSSDTWNIEFRNDLPDKVMSIAAIFNGSLKGAEAGYFGYNAESTGDDVGAYTHLDVNHTTLGIFDFGAYTLNRWISYKMPDGAIVNIQAIAKGCTVPNTKTLKEMLADSEFQKCIGYVDVDGVKGMNKEVLCQSGDNNTKFEPDKPCTVKKSDITDIFPVVFHDSTVEPASNAAAYVLHTSK